MADPIRNYQTSAVPGVRADIDQGLRAYMVKVYNLMGLGLLITGLAAVGTIMLATTTDPASAVATLPSGEMLTPSATRSASPLRWVVMLAPLAAVMFLSFRVQSMSVSAAQTTFWVYAGLDRPVAVVDLPGLHHGQYRRRPSSPPPLAFGALSPLRLHDQARPDRRWVRS